MSEPGTAVLRRAIEELFTSEPGSAAPGTVGVELELIPVRERAGEPIRQLPLQEVLGFLRGAPPELGIELGKLGFELPEADLQGGGRLTFEPGGQLEYSGPPLTTAREAGAELRRVMGGLRRAAEGTGLELVDAGIVDPTEAYPMELQLPTVRYRAMDSRFSKLGPWGRVMMCRTGSMQVNLDLGSPQDMAARFRLANLLTPVLGGAFANAPFRLPGGERAASGRLWLWSRLDAARTGFQTAVTDRDPVDAYLDFALNAAVLLRTDGSRLEAGDGRTFAAWLADPRGREPTAEDWTIHLTTLFPHVRPRGWIEIRYLDTPREEWWDVPLVVLTALLYDAETRDRAIELLSPFENRLAQLTERAARTGVADEEVGEMAERGFRMALEGASRLPGDYFGAAQVSAAEEFLSRFTSRRLTQADESVRGTG